MSPEMRLRRNAPRKIGPILLVPSVSIGMMSDQPIPQARACAPSHLPFPASCLFRATHWKSPNTVPRINENGIPPDP